MNCPHSRQRTTPRSTSYAQYLFCPVCSGILLQQFSFLSSASISPFLWLFPISILLFLSFKFSLDYTSPLAAALPLPSVSANSSREFSLLSLSSSYSFSSPFQSGTCLHHSTKTALEKVTNEFASLSPMVDSQSSSPRTLPQHLTQLGPPLRL